VAFFFIVFATNSSSTHSPFSVNTERIVKKETNTDFSERPDKKIRGIREICVRNNEKITKIFGGFTNFYLLCAQELSAKDFRS
jgi:hypothetical protein